MLAFSAGRFGPTSPAWPFLLFVVTLSAFVGSVVLAVVDKVRHRPLRVPNLVAAIAWAIATGCNIWTFQGVLYVA